MSRPQIIRFLMVIVSLCLSLSALAGTIELEAVGQVTVSGFASVPVGTTLTAFLFYNPAAVPLDTGANYADYVSAQASVFEFGGSTLTAQTPGTSGWDILDELNNTGADVWGVPLGYDAMVWVESAPSATGPIASDPGYDSTGFASFELQFSAPDANGVLTSTALPSIFPSLPGEWTDTDFIYLPITGSGATFAGTFNSVVEVTPEPDSAILLVIGLAAVLLGYTRKGTAKT